ncbi:MAG: hypothetical protein LC781_02210, partial [Actinobacteria bacterium]|nr:hypothetical protein [Actinomycetota bacterium]
QARSAITNKPQRAIKSLPEAPANTVPSVYEPTTTISNKPPVGVDLLLIEPLCEELRGDIVYGSQTYWNKPRVQV